MPSNTKPIGVAYTDQDIINSQYVLSGEYLGYTADAQGSVTQGTSKSTAVTLNKSAGVISVNAASLAATTSVNFTLNNSFISANDTVILTLANSGAAPGSYTAIVSALTTGSATITVRNITASPLAEALTLNFSLVHHQ
jgi:N-acetylmuramic acid 6-phosphate (MurNAc-6-P) etherase